MRSRSAIVGLAAALLLAACFPSVHPYYTDDDIRFDPALLGEWTEDEERWIFERHPDEDRRYRLQFTDGDNHGTVTATLFELGEHRFLDVIAADIDFADEQWEMINASVFPGHLVFHVAEIGPRLRMSLFDVDWLEEYIEEHPRSLGHIEQGSIILLTAETRRLQRFLRRHVDGGLFESDYTALLKTADGS